MEDKNTGPIYFVREDSSDLHPKAPHFTPCIHISTKTFNIFLTLIRRYTTAEVGSEGGRAVKLLILILFGFFGLILYWS